MAITREFLVRESVPQRLIDEMMQRSSKEIYWLSVAEVARIPGRAPWFEEWLIARCNFDPAIAKEWVARAMAYPKGVEQYRRCDRIRLEAQDAYIRSLKASK